ncbi:MAG TPA: prepilin-type N-terminal cleavage/methylation domain-containing protein [Myxococcaceae bacterium]|nr:prepilin-type N-terminal cleavage/methylation domain-containing protein [Myxococcaceae bacterium]
MSAPTERRRGFTLLELMVAAAVGLVILTAAMAAFDLQSQFARNTERLLSTQATAGLGLTMMQRDLENAGLRFRGGAQVDGGVAFATVVRPYDNLGSGVTTLKNDPLGSTTVVAVAPPLPGFIPGTDAFEVLQGGQQATSQRVAAQVQSVTSPALNQRTVRIAPNPFIANELSAVGSFAPVLMFWSDDLHCMGRVVPPITGGLAAQATVQTVDADLALSGNPWPAGCPGPLMQVEVLQQRHRYLVYQSADNIAPGVRRPARIGLYLQSNPPCDPVGTGVQVCTTDLQAPVMVAEGVDDMQIAWRVPDAFASASAPPGWCQRNTTDPSCGFELAPWTATITQRAAAIYGAQIMLTSRGQEIYRRPGEPIPPLLNHVPATPDGIVRSIMQTSVLFRNSVTP